jgi:peptide/nickel transport system permease protein
MLLFTIRRLVQSLIVLFFVSIAVFAMVHFLPGDPARQLVPVGDQTLDPEQYEASVERVREQYGLNDPLPVQYVRWIGRAMQGDLGVSIQTKQEVGSMIQQRLPVTMTIGIIAAVISLIIAIPAGVIAATRRNSGLDIFATITSLSTVAIPSFWLGMLLILVFVVWLGWLPGPGSYVKLWVDPVESLKRTILPALALSGYTTAALMRLTRSSMLEVLSQDYIRTARAKGLRGWTVLVRHAIRNALMPVITFFGLQVIFLLSGSVIIERLFAIPGAGAMAIDAIFQRDFPVIQGFTLVVAALVVLVNFLVDVTYGLIDPRIRVR